VFAWCPLAASESDALGNRALLRGDQAWALTWFDRSLRLEPTWPMLHEDRGRALAQSSPAAAIAEFERADCGPPCDAQIGDALVRLGKPAEAIDHYLRARAVGRVSAMALELVQTGKVDDAIALEQALIGRLHDGFVERADLASAYASLGLIESDAAALHPDKAIQLRRQAVLALGEAVQRAPFNEGYLLSYASALAYEGDIAAARQAYQRLLKLHPGEPDAQAALATLSGAAPNAGATPSP
jgi:tetratricopeptide (TPR) repeat protein